MITNESRQAVKRGLVLGACEQLAERTGAPTLLVRAGLIVALCLWFKLAVLAYCIGAVAFRLERR
jgi:phage shock protein PspC (stress-responsive transcriptional regulator)